MKTTTKWIASVAFAAAIFFTGNAKAQMTTPAPANSNPWRFGIGLEAGVPTGDAHNASDFELGGTARLQYDFTQRFAITLTSGYYNMFGKDNNGVDYGSLGLVPVKLGIKAFFAPQFYFGAEGGAAFETNQGAYNQTKLDLSPALGWASKSWDVSARYENFSGQGNNFGLVGLRVAYGFGL
jgi:hypothetical protein